VIIKLTIVIETVNAAFDDEPAIEIARILRAMAARIESNGIPPVPRGINGNICGSVKVKGVKP
jgi:hypothetical protein